MLTSENKCSLTYPTIRAWSGKMREIGLKFRYWQTYFRHLTQNHISNDTLHRSTQNASITHRQKAKVEISSKIYKIQTEIREMKQNHLELRKEMLQEFTEEYADKNNRQATDVIKEIITTEEIKKITETLDTP